LGHFKYSIVEMTQPLPSDFGIYSPAENKTLHFTELDRRLKIDG